MTDGRGNPTLYAFAEPAGQSEWLQVTATAPGAATTTLLFDDRGLKRREVTPENVQHTYEYDDRGNAIQHRWGVGALAFEESATYHPTFSIPTMTKDARGSVTTYAVDGATGVVREKRLPNGSVLRYDYHPNGDLWRATDQQGLVTEVTSYDAYGNPTVVTQHVSKDPVTGAYSAVVTRNEFDVRSRLRRTESTLGATMTYTYDALDRPVRVETSPGAYREAFVTETTYLSGGQVDVQTSREASGESYSADHEYDDLDRVTTVAETVSGSASYTRTYEYDANSNVTKSVDRRGVETILAYNALSRRSSATGPT